MYLLMKHLTKLGKPVNSPAVSKGNEIYGTENSNI